MPPSESIPSDEPEQLERLREILLGPEFDALAILVSRFEDPEARARYVAEVLSEAILLRADRDPSLPRALAQPVAAAVRTSVEHDPRPIVDAIFPIIGPAIRRSVSEMMSSMVERVSTMVDQSFSARGLHWRFEAWRSGLPFGEVVLRHTLQFRVEQVFWIHRETGVLLLHAAGGDRETQDPDMVSGMLTAIRDFMHDSFEAEGGDVRSMEMGDCRLVVRDGPVSSLAALVRGAAPVELSNLLHETLEELDHRYGSRLASFDGDVAPLAPAEPSLAACLVSQTSPVEPSLGGRLWPWAVAALLIAALGAWGVRTHQRDARWERALASLRSVPGIVLLEATRGSGGYRIEGLRDPLAELPEVSATLDRPLVAAWRPYLSLDPPILAARAEATLNAPAGVRLDLRGDTLHLSGAAPLGWLRELAQRPPLVAGLDRIDVQELVPDATSEIAALERLELGFETAESRLSEGARAEVTGAAEELLELAAAVAPFGFRPELRVSGSADRRGEQTRNQELARERAEGVAAVLVGAGVPPGWVAQESAVSASEADSARRTRLSIRLVERAEEEAKP